MELAIRVAPARLGATRRMSLEGALSARVPSAMEQVDGGGMSRDHMIQFARPRLSAVGACVRGFGRCPFSVRIAHRCRGRPVTEDLCIGMEGLLRNVSSLCHLAQGHFQPQGI